MLSRLYCALIAFAAMSAFAQTTPTVQVKTISDLVALRIPVPSTRFTALVTGRVTENDGGGGVFYYQSGSTATTNLGTIFKPTATTGRWLRQYNGSVDVKWFGALGDGSDQSAAVQNAMNIFGTNGGGVFIPVDVKFTMTALVATNRVTLQYFGGNDLSVNAGPVIGSRESITMFATFNVDGIVNEQRFESAYHPGLILNVRKNLTLQNSVLGSGQSLTNPARGSFIIQDEGHGAVIEQYQSYTNTTGTSGFSMRSHWPHYTFTGINTGSFATDPAVGEIIVGTTSKATGFVVSISGSNLIVHWITGTFVVGETVSDANETTTDTIASSTYSEQYNGGVFFDRDRDGNVAINNITPTYPVTMSGAVGIQGTVTFGQFIRDNYTRATMVWGDNLASGGTKLWMNYDASGNIFGVSDSHVVFGTTNGFTNPQGWNRVIAVVGSGNGAAISLKDGTSEWNLASTVGTYKVSKGASAPSFYIDTSDNIGFSGQTTFGTDASKVIALPLANQPTTSPADAVQLWARDRDEVAGKAGLRVRSEDGTSYTLSDVFISGGGRRIKRNAQAGVYQILISDHYIFSSATSTKTLPDASDVGAGAVIIIKSGTGATTTVARSAGDTIDGAAADDSLAALASGTYISDGGTNWEKN